MNRLPTLLIASAILTALVSSAPMRLEAATLTNRYSFTVAAEDSVGGQNGALMGGAVVSDGQALLNGTDAYVDLPNNLLTNRESITIEAWITPESNPDWVRIWDFGNSNGGEDQPDFGVTHFMAALKPSLRATIYAGGTDSWVYSAPAVLLPENTPVHVVWTSDATTKRARLYVDGKVVGSNPEALNTPASMGPTFNNWLGRSQFSADAYFWGSIDEFRIWDGALNALEVAASSRSGPQTVDTDAGSVTNVALQVSATMIRGDAQQAAVLASASKLAQPGDIADTGAVAFKSSNTNILTVDAYGVVSARAIGTASVTATYANLSDTHSVTVADRPAVLTHRYNFVTNANDVVGTAHGTLRGAAVITDGKAVLNPEGESHVELPAGVLGDSRSITIETWASFGETATWSRVWHLGDQNDSGGARYYVEFSPHGSAGDIFIGVSDSDPGGAHADAVARPGLLDNQTNVQVVAVFNPLGGYHALYVNGALAARNFNPTVRDLTKVQDLRNYIGRSLYAVDPYLNAAIDEFRIYDGVLSPVEAATSYAAGPDQPRMNPGALKSIRWGIPTSLSLDGTQVPTVLATYENLIDFNVTGNSLTAAVPGLGVSSSATNIVSVEANGVLRARAAGTATLTATYQGQTADVTVTVTRPVAVLKHRFSFTSDAKDSVGGADGALQGSAAVQGGKLQLDGTPDTYLELPGGIVSGLKAVTLEFWADFGASGLWSRVFDFGSIAGNNGANFLFFTPRTGNSTHRFAIGASAGNVDLDRSGIWSNRSLHVACVYDPGAGFMGIYTNGVAEVVNINARVPLSAVGKDFSFVGRSLFAADAFLNASIDEFRIYEGRLYPDELAATHQLGPDALLSDRATLGVSMQSGQIVFSWPATLTGYVLQSSPTLGPTANWQPVTATPSAAGSNVEVRLAPAGASAFYRLGR